MNHYEPQPRAPWNFPRQKQEKHWPGVLLTLAIVLAVACAAGVLEGPL